MDMYCDHPVVKEDPQTSEVVCMVCSEVLDHRHLASSHTTSCGTLGLSPLNNFSIGLSTVIKPEGVDYSGRKINKRMVTCLVDSSRKAKTSPAISKNKFRGILQLQRICNTLDLPKNVEENTREKFVEFCEKGYLKGRHLFSCIYCILLISAAEEDYPLNINQILKCTSTTRKRINMDYHMIYRLYDDAPKTMAGARAHAEKIMGIVKEAGWEGYPLYVQVINRVLLKLQARGITGRRAIIVLAATSIDYLKKENYPALSTFIKSTGLNKNTILSKLEELKDSLPDLME